MDDDYITHFHSDDFHYYHNPYFLVDNIRCPNKRYVLAKNMNSNVRYPSFIQEKFGKYIEAAMNSRRYDMGGVNLINSSHHVDPDLKQIPDDDDSFLKSVDRIYHASILDSDNGNGLLYQLVGRLRARKRGRSKNVPAYFALYAESWEFPVEYPTSDEMGGVVDEGFGDAVPTWTSLIVLSFESHIFLSEFIGPGILIDNSHGSLTRDRIMPRNDLERDHILALWSRDSLLCDNKGDLNLYATYPMIIMHGIIDNKGIEGKANFGKEILRIIYKPIFKQKHILIFNLDSRSEIKNRVTAEQIYETIFDNIDVVYQCDFIEDDDNVKLQLFGRVEEVFNGRGKLYFMLRDVKETDTTTIQGELLFSHNLARLMRAIHLPQHLYHESTRRLLSFIRDTDGEDVLNNVMKLVGESLLSEFMEKK